MKLISLTLEERDLLVPLAQKRLQEWKQIKLSDSGSQKRFERSYLFSLLRGFAKVDSGRSYSYTDMERGILSGCIKESIQDLIEKEKSAEYLEKIHFLRILQKKFDVQKKRLVEVN